MDAIQLPGVTLPTTLGQPGQVLPPGQLIQALVLELLESNVFRLQLPQAIVDVRSDVALTPGSTITLAAKGTGPNTRLVIYADAPVAAGQGNAPTSLAGRQPIGEAVIIARAPAGTPNRIAEPLAPSVPPLAPGAPSIARMRQSEAPACLSRACARRGRARRCKPPERNRAAVRRCRAGRDASEIARARPCGGGRRPFRCASRWMKG